MRIKTKGFKKRTSVDEALKILLSHTPLPSIEEIGISRGLNRVLACDILAKIDVPPFDRAAMDGYAVRAEDTFGASQTNPIYLKVAGEVKIGEAKEIEVKPNEAIKIATGAPLPKGANAVLMYEYTRELDEEIEVLKPVTPGKNVSFKGEDVKKGEILLKKGRILKPHDIGLLASFGIEKIKVYRRAKVGIISTGDELVNLGEKLSEGKIYESNSYMLASLVKTSNSIPERKGIVKDNKEEIKKAIKEALSNDVIIITGGTSVGKRDLVPEIIAEIGKILVHGISLRPGEPTGFGVIEDKIIFMLPGNPVACFVAFETLIRPMLQKMQGLSLMAYSHYLVAKGILKRKIPSEIGRRDFVRVKFDGKYVEPIRVSGAGILSTLVRADGFVIVPENLEGFEEGEEVEVRLFHNYFSAP